MSEYCWEKSEELTFYFKFWWKGKLLFSAYEKMYTSQGHKKRVDLGQNNVLRSPIMLRLDGYIET